MIINNNNIFSLKFVLIGLIPFLCTCITQQKRINNNDYYVNPNIKEEKVEEIKDLFYRQEIISQDLKSLTFSTRSLILAEPCYNLGSGNPVDIKFDLLRNNPETIQYELIHCDRKWNKSYISSINAIDGFDVNYIENQNISYGSVEQYINYSFRLPNENTNFLISGNFIIKIYVEGENENPLALIKFFVSEQISNLKFKIDESSNVEQSKYLQSYELECSYNPNNIMDPFSNIYINIQQNHQDFDQQWISGPSFIKENKLVFLPSDSQTFNGGNEFRFFDMSSFRIGSQKIDKIYFNDTTFQILLKEDEKRSFKQYLQYNEMNGRFFIRTYDNDQADFQSEYGWVLFRLPMRKLVNDSIYIYGQISNWAIDDRFLMKYDSLSKSYFNKSILKQGYYNYIYVVKNSQGISTRKIEGSHFETSNEYVVKIYYEDPLNLYDRILCYNLVKSN